MTMITINLLPPEMRRSTGRMRLSKSSMVGALGALAFVGLLVGLTAIQSARLSSVESDVLRAQAKVDQLQEDIQLVDRLEDVKTKILRRMSAIESLDRHRGYWVHNVEDILAVIPNYLWLSGFKQDGAPRRKRGAVEDTVQGPPSYLIDGYCFTISSLANLIMNLQDSPRFSNVALRRTQMVLLEERHVYEFEVVCQLETLETERLHDDAATPVQLGVGSEDDGSAPLSEWDDADQEPMMAYDE